MCRASTHCLAPKKGVDARDKRGHDGGGARTGQRNRTSRTPAGKRNLNPPKNKLWDSAAVPVQAPPSILDALWSIKMVERTLVFGLLFASLTNVVCLYTCL
jgi:hypothetical protein